MKPDLKQFSLDSLSDIQCTYWIGSHPGKSYQRDVLIVRFKGTYRIGSAGNPDATFMVSLGNAGVEALDPDAIIIDLSGLKYEWGDMMDSVFGIGWEREVPTAILVGEHCREAIGTLCFGVNSTSDACEREGIFDSIDDAWQYVTKLIDEGDIPPFHEAAKVGDLELVESLLKGGEDPNRTDATGQTALHKASSPAIVRLLIESGADVRAKSKYGITPLHLVTNLQCARLLLDAGADPDARSWTDSSPLGHAQLPEIVSFLIESGADIHQRRRNSLLHSVRRPAIANIFIKAGADVNMLDENGHTPLDRAVESEQQFAKQANLEVAQRYAEIAALLRSHGGKSAEQLRTERERR